MNTTTHSAVQRTVSLLACSMFVAMFCTPPPATQTQPILVTERYASYTADSIAAETARLKELSATTADSIPKLDSATRDSSTEKPLSKTEITARLFELSIHRLNPELDYEKALEYAKSLFENKSEFKLYYANWGRVLRDRIALESERDSLLAVIGDMNAEIESLQSKKHFSQRQSNQIDSLQTVIKQQERQIKKLGELDMMMERQRSRIQ